MPVPARWPGSVVPWRGNGHVRESDRRALEVLRRNATTLGLPGAVVLPGSVEAILATASASRST